MKAYVFFLLIIIATNGYCQESPEERYGYGFHDTGLVYENGIKMYYEVVENRCCPMCVFKIYSIMDGVPQQSFKFDSGGWDYGGYVSIYAHNPDINFDGYQDLEYIVSAVKGEVARYHVWNEAESRFNYVGEFPRFKIDSVRKTLTSYPYPGHDTVPIKRIYTFPDNGLELVLLEEKER